jgi:hypothetical protein
MMTYGTQTAGLTPVITSGNNDGWGGGNGILGLLALLGVFRGGIGGYGNGTGAGIADAAIVNPQFQSINTQLQGLQSQMSNNAITSELESMENTMNSGMLSVLSGIKDNANLYLQGQGALSTSIATGNFNTQNTVNNALSAITAQSNQNALQQLNSANILNTSFLQGINTLSSGTQNSTNQIISSLQAQNMQAAECCCSIKNAIHSDGEATRALINSLNVQNLEQQLNDAKQQNSTLAQTITQQQITNAQTATILQHLKPFPVVA